MRSALLESLQSRCVDVEVTQERLVCVNPENGCLYRCSVPGKQVCTSFCDGLSLSSWLTVAYAFSRAELCVAECRSLHTSVLEL